MTEAYLATAGGGIQGLTVGREQVGIPRAPGSPNARHVAERAA